MIIIYFVLDEALGNRVIEDVNFFEKLCIIMGVEVIARAILENKICRDNGAEVIQ